MYRICQNLQGNTWFVALIQQWCLLIFGIFLLRVVGRKSGSFRRHLSWGSSGKSRHILGGSMGCPCCLSLCRAVFNPQVVADSSSQNVLTPHLFPHQKKLGRFKKKMAEADSTNNSLISVAWKCLWWMPFMMIFRWKSCPQPLIVVQVDGKFWAPVASLESWCVVDEKWQCCVEYFDSKSDAAGQGHCCRSVPN